MPSNNQKDNRRPYSVILRGPFSSGSYFVSGKILARNSEEALHLARKEALSSVVPSLAVHHGLKPTSWECICLLFGETMPLYVGSVK
jgi:hypothetical protein